MANPGPMTGAAGLVSRLTLAWPGQGSPRHSAFVGLSEAFQVREASGHLLALMVIRSTLEGDEETENKKR